MRTQIALLLCLLGSINTFFAQNYESDQFSIKLAYGMITPDDGTIDYSSSLGINFEGNYVYGVKTWFQIRPYAGVFTAINTGGDIDTNRVGQTSLMFGAKGRLVAPIRNFGPFVELGYGASLGNFRTLTAETDESKKGFYTHIPVSAGIAVGNRQNFDIAFTYFFYPNLAQTTSIFGGSLSIDF